MIIPILSTHLKRLAILSLPVKLESIFLYLSFMVVYPVFVTIRNLPFEFFSIGSLHIVFHLLYLIFIVISKLRLSKIELVILPFLFFSLKKRFFVVFSYYSMRPIINSHSPIFEFPQIFFPIAFLSFHQFLIFLHFVLLEFMLVSFHLFLIIVFVVHLIFKIFTKILFPFLFNFSF